MKRILKGAYRSFVILGLPKAAIEVYIPLAKPLINTLIKDQLKQMQSTKTIMTVWMRREKPMNIFITLDPKYKECSQDKCVILVITTS